MRVKTQDLAHTPPPIYQPYTYPNLDPIPLIKKFTKYKKIPQIIKTRKTQAAPQQVQHHLRHYPRHFGAKFRIQAAHHLVANHLFKLPHFFHIYNNQGKKENMETFLKGGDSNTWCKAVGDELGRLENGIDNQVRATNTIEFIRKE